MASQTEGVASVPFIEPMQCLPVKRLPSGDQWEYELKLDGYRILAVKHQDRVTLFSRNQKALTVRYPGVADALGALPDDTIIDGELVALDESGRPSFNTLQNASVKTPVVFYAFDLLRLAGRDLLNKPLKERREILQTRVMPGLAREIRYSETFPVTAEEMLEAVKAQGLEGVIAKRLDSVYEPGERSGAWVKMRVGLQGELVIGGFIPAGRNFDALIVGSYEADGLMYAGKVRAGFVPASRAQVFARLKPFVRETCPFANLPDPKKGRWGEGLTAEDMAKCVWLEPKLIAVIDYAELTPAKRLRHPRFSALSCVSLPPE